MLLLSCFWWLVLFWPKETREKSKPCFVGVFKWPSLWGWHTPGHKYTEWPEPPSLTPSLNATRPSLVGEWGSLLVFVKFIFLFSAWAGVFIYLLARAQAGMLGSIPQARWGWAVPLWRQSRGVSQKIEARCFFSRRLVRFYHIHTVAVTIFLYITLCLNENNPLHRDPLLTYRQMTLKTPLKPQWLHLAFWVTAEYFFSPRVLNVPPAGEKEKKNPTPVDTQRRKAQRKNKGGGGKVK